MYFRYLGRELRRRARSATVVAVGLALAIGLVITVTAAAAGVTKAQGQVLRSLYGVGTAITVTETPTAGGGGGFRFGGAPPTRAQQGKAFSRDRLSSSGGLSPLKASAVSDIAHLRDVEGATGSLSLTSIHVTGTFSGGPGGGSGSGAASSTPFSITTFTVAGVNADDPGLGPLSAGN
ncbi:MAG TPA: ABC transporter permease, partial [Candidatus Dormibacteraeota bacterium]